jgi:hypothetical protein
VTPWLLLALAPALGLMLLGALADTLDRLWWELQLGCALAFGDPDGRLAILGPRWPR